MKVGKNDTNCHCYALKIYTRVKDKNTMQMGFFFMPDGNTAKLNCLFCKQQVYFTRKNFTIFLGDRVKQKKL